MTSLMKETEKFYFTKKKSIIFFNFILNKIIKEFISDFFFGNLTTINKKF